MANFFTRLGPFKSAFLFVFIFVTIWIVALVADPIEKDITASVTQEITAELTEGIIEVFINGCTTELGLVIGSQDFEFCEERTRAGLELTDFKAEDCSLCGPRPDFPDEEGLCLTGADVPFCESLIPLIEEETKKATAEARDLPIAQLGTGVRSFTGLFENILEPVEVLGIEVPQLIIWIVVLFVAGFFAGGGKIKI